MGHDLAMRTAMAAGLGLVAAAGNLLGGYFVVRKDWPRQYLQYFLALGAGYMLAGGFFQIFSGASSLAGRGSVFFLLEGFFFVTHFELTMGPHFTFDQATQKRGMSQRSRQRSAS